MMDIELWTYDQTYLVLLFLKYMLHMLNMSGIKHLHENQPNSMSHHTCAE